MCSGSRDNCGLLGTPAPGWAGGDCPRASREQAALQGQSGPCWSHPLQLPAQLSAGPARGWDQRGVKLRHLAPWHPNSRLGAASCHRVQPVCVVRNIKALLKTQSPWWDTPICQHAQQKPGQGARCSQGSCVGGQLRKGPETRNRRVSVTAPLQAGLTSDPNARVRVHTHTHTHTHTPAP